jgi:hypothetical protein
MPKHRTSKSNWTGSARPWLEVPDETWVDDNGDLCRNHDSPWPRLLKRVVGRRVEVVSPTVQA